MAQLRSELLKLRTTRTTLALALGLILIVVGAALGQGLAIDASELGDEDTQRGLFATGGFSLLFSALIGIMVVTGEFRHGTIRPTLVFSPRRERVLVAKVAAALLGGLLLTAIAEALVLAIGFATLSSRGIDVVLGSGEVAAIVGGTLLAGALWGGIGAGLGAVVRSQVGAIVGLLAWMFIAESLLFGLAPRYGRWAPGIASNALSGEETEHLLSPMTGGVLLAAYLALFAALGAVSLLKRDVP
jgi:ABC-type transport system involved in multi-copper enzyme maturation permease subunit